MAGQDSGDWDEWIEYSLRVVVDGEATFNELGVSKPRTVWRIAMRLLSREVEGQIELDIFRRYWTPKRKAG
jgi:hypothetical protein